MNVTLRQLRAFVTLAHLQSFTRAAEQMHLTQPALSLLLRQLEENLGTKLVDRTTRSLELTAAGRELMPRAERVLGDLEHALSGVKEFVAKEQGRLVLAAPLLLSSALLPEAVALFRARYPSVSLMLKDSLPQHVLPNVRNRVADLGLGTFHADEPDIERTTLFTDPLVAVCARDHPFARKARVTWRELANVPVIGLTRDSIFRELAEQGFQRVGLPFEPLFEVSYVGTALGLAQEGLGVTIVPGYARKLVVPAKAKCLPIEAPVIKREVSIIRLARRSLTPAAEAFTEFLREYLAEKMPAK